MGCVICIAGELSADEISEDTAEKITAIQDGWGSNAFKVHKNTITFVASEQEGCNPLSDAVVKPLEELLDLAKSEGIVIDGDIEISSNWSDYDNITFIIAENQMKSQNTEIINASTEELVEELKSRDSYERANRFYIINRTWFSDKDPERKIAYEEILCDFGDRTFTVKCICEIDCVSDEWLFKYENGTVLTEEERVALENWAITCG